MKLYVGVTDENWFNYLRDLNAEEVNFWRPTAKTAFKVLAPGELFLFRLRAPKRVIVGGGTFVTYSRLPLSVAWDSFAEKNGTANVETLQLLINKYRQGYKLPVDPDPLIGCVILNNTFFLNNRDRIAEPSDWKPGLVQGKSYETSSEIGQEILTQLSSTRTLPRFIRTTVLENRSTYQTNISNDIDNEEDNETTSHNDDHSERYGSSYSTRGRLGQGAFRVLVIEAYNHRCAMTGTGALPALQASHIKPYAQLGPHSVTNGILLRVDLHNLFDRGYITITPDYKIKVSPKLQEAYEDVTEYYQLDGKPLQILPKSNKSWPAPKFIEWHNQNVFLQK